MKFPVFSFSIQQHLRDGVSLQFGSNSFYPKFLNESRQRKPARRPTKKFSSLFLMCASRIFSSKRKRKLFCWVLLRTSRAAGLASIFCKNTAEFPPHPPSAVFLRGRTGFLAAASSFSLPLPTCAEKIKELPLIKSKYFGNIILCLGLSISIQQFNVTNLLWQSQVKPI